MIFGNIVGANNHSYYASIFTRCCGSGTVFNIKLCIFQTFGLCKAKIWCKSKIMNDIFCFKWRIDCLGVSSKETKLEHIQTLYFYIFRSLYLAC